MGLYPRKGALAVGSDADIVLLDPRAGARDLRKEDLHETDYTPWEGHEVAAWPSMTILRGKIVVEDGNFLGDLQRRPVPAAQDPGRDSQPAGGVIGPAPRLCGRGIMHGRRARVVSLAPT